MGFQQLFYPKAVAVFGSLGEGKIGNQLVTQLVNAGFPKIFAINPKGVGLGDVPGFATILAVGQPVDLAVIATPAFTVPAIMEDCGKAGIRAAVIISSGFSEAGNLAGEQEVLKIAKKYKICFAGPNCAGMVNTYSKLAATIETCPPMGHTALISQSGSVGGVVMDWCFQQGLGISKFVSYGNGADLNQIEFLRYLKDDEETKVIALYIENIVDGAQFMTVLKEVTAVKPVVVVKSGRTDTGQRAALSHTGSMAGADGVYDAAFAECGAIRVSTIEEMLDLCKGFSTLPPLNGDRIAIVTNSGGPGVLATDMAEELGLQVLPPQKNVLERLKQILPPHAGFFNPIDMTVEGTAENYHLVTEAMLQENNAVVGLFVGTPFLDTLEVAKGLVKAYEATGSCIVPVLQTGANLRDAIDFLNAHGLANFPSAERAVKVLAKIYAYHQYLAKTQNLSPVAHPQVKGRLFQNGCLLEPAAMGILAENNISVPPFRFVTKPEDLEKACTEVGYPLVLKVVANQILHKTDFGGVVLQLTDLAQAQAAFAQIAAKAANYGFAGVMVYPMITGAKEVLLGFTRDPQFGPVVAFGLGGIYTEVLKDIVLRVAPVCKKDALEMICAIRSYPILAGIRGEKPVDLNALADLIVAFSKLPFLYPDLAEADLNPIFALEHGAVVGDVRLVGANKA